MSKVRIGIIGIGVMGTIHAKYLIENPIKNAELTAVCDIDAKKLDNFKEMHGDKIASFADYKELLKSGLVDSVLIAVPHYDHPQIAIHSFEAGMHVLVEKPAGVFVNQVKEMNEAAKKSGKVFSIMFCMRTHPYFKTVRELIKSGELGEIKRINWIITTWYRPQSYHDSSTWRSSWKDEGGGLLINQCPHNLDLWQWTVGMPTKIYSKIGFGKYYKIEVDDDVTAVMEYENGATGTFISSTAEVPGTNRLEIVGDMGKVVYENDEIIFCRNRESEREFNSKFKGFISQPDTWECKIPVKGEPMSHRIITENFVNAILNEEELIAPGEDGILSLTMSNAMYLSAWEGKEITLPMDNDKFESILNEKIKNSTFTKGEK